MEEFFLYFGKYNFWNNNIPKLGYTRQDYLEKISGFCNNSLIKVLTGQRRTGKSYLLRQIAYKLIETGTPAKNIFYINKEFLEYDDIKDYIDLDALIKSYQKYLKPKGKVYLFIDEIQNIQEWERIINSYSQNFAENYEVFISGSNSKMLSGELATLLSGRYINFEILPFSFTEYIGINEVENTKESYTNYLKSGGLPELLSLPNDETKQNYVSAVKDTVLLRDIIQRNAIKEPKLLEDLFVYLVNTASNLMSVNNITNYFKSKGRKTTYDTVAAYIGYIEDTFLIHKVERFDIRGKDTVAGNVKYYCNDLAYKNYLFSGFAYGLGYLLENMIYLELRRSGFQVYVGVLPNKEVDFVARKSDRVLYLQSSYSLADESTAQREYSALEAISDHYEKLVVSLDDITLPINNGIKHIQAWNLHAFLS
jgi:predicted AAA+ superfamily ATPase